jgi:O-antigen/teichoic acid export membrane protein
MRQSKGLAQRTLSSISWQMGASVVNIVVLFGRSILLARLLPVEVFGIYAFATSILTLTAPLTEFGMGGAFLHRAPETQDEDEAAAVHLSLKVLFLFAWVTVIVLGARLFTEGQERMTLVWLVVIRSLTYLTQTPRLILHRRVVHRRIALLQTLSALFTTLFAVTLAWQGITVWALIATDAVIMLLSMLLLYVWRPVWRPHFAWRPQVIRYYLSFGSRVLASDLLSVSLDQIDDLWTRIFLGNTPLGFYSRAFSFATYPRSILAAPVTLVIGGTYAELKGRRGALSQAFFRVNALLLRAGFLFSGLLFLIAPEFIRLVIGAKWMPMLDSFRLMLVFTLLHPIKATMGNMFVAVGEPTEVLKVRLLQLLLLVLGLFLLGPTWGILGVAFAVDIMAAVGTVALLHRAYAHVDYSVKRLFAAPLLSLVTALVLAHAGAQIQALRVSDWFTGAVKAIVFTTVYGSLLLVLERQDLTKILRQVNFLRSKGPVRS